MKQAGIHKCLGIRQCCDHFHADPGILIFIIVTIKEVWLNYCFYSLKNSIFLSENHFFFIIVVEMEHRITNLFCDVGKFNRSNRFRINNSNGFKKNSGCWPGVPGCAALSRPPRGAQGHQAGEHPAGQGLECEADRFWVCQGVGHQWAPLWGVRHPRLSGARTTQVNTEYYSVESVLPLIKVGTKEENSVQKFFCFILAGADPSNRLRAKYPAGSAPQHQHWK